ncbi:MAG: hypothetical protein R6V35_01550 [Candidatus Nanohaloarchaea archaeon]
MPSKVNKKGFTSNQVEALNDEDLIDSVIEGLEKYRKRLEKFENDYNIEDKFVSSEYLSKVSETEMSEMTTFLGALRSKKKIRGDARSNGYNWRVEPLESNWRQIGDEIKEYDPE